jgi:hypothetical protein
MIKINLAVFAIASVGTALIYCAPRDLIGRITRSLVQAKTTSFYEAHSKIAA